ncbi:MAG: hypothetical protein K2K43_00130 [Alistipes sp.]|nr:hypothetical protein [Alistipes sp.]
MLKKLIYSLLFASIAFAFVSCGESPDDNFSNDYKQEEDEKKDNEKDDEKDDEKENGNENKDETGKYDYYTESGLYLGITGFNSDLRRYYYANAGFRLLNLSTCYSFKYFVSSLETADGTILYYAMENTLSQLEKSKFPNDLKSVSIITFTDGLDQGSSAKNDTYQSGTAYLEAIQTRIQSTKVNGLNIEAYSIGLKGQDVKNDTQFLSNLKGLASSDDDEHVMEVANMDEVNDKFMNLAASLYKENTSQSLKVSIPKPYNNVKIRFTFDAVDDASNSTCYIEGIFTDGSLTQIEYKGVSSSSGNTIKGVLASINISFAFDNLVFEADNELTISRIKQWEWIPETSLWQVNSEFNPDKSTETTVEKRSAAIVLLLDCSSSLGSDLEKIKQTVQNFIDVLSQTSSHETASTQVRFSKQGTYYGIPELLVVSQQNEPLAGYDFGTSTGTSPYFEIPSGYHYPAYVLEQEKNNYYRYMIQENPHTYNFEKGKKYTITFSEPDDAHYRYDIECDE